MLQLWFCLLFAAAAAAEFQISEVCHELSDIVPSHTREDQSKGHLIFNNRLSETVTVHWVDFEGSEREIGRVAPFSRFSMNTFSGHIWRVRRADDSKFLLSGTIYFPEGSAGASVETEIVDDCSSSSAILSEPVRIDEDSHWRETSPEAVLATSPALKHCALDSLLSEIPSRGLHVICPIPLVERSAEGRQQVRLCIFQGGVAAERCTASMVFEYGGVLSSDDVDGSENTAADAKSGVLRTFHDVLIHTMKELKAKKLSRRHPDPALYSDNGTRMGRKASLAEFIESDSGHRALILFIGGQWMWPSVRVGFERDISDIIGSSSRVVLRTVALIPRVFEVIDFLSPVESGELLTQGAPHVTTSGVVKKDRDVDMAVENWRTSKTWFLSSASNPILEDVEKKVMRMTRVPLTHAEDAQILKYDPNGRYDFHHDYFDPADYQQSPFLTELDGGSKNRMVNTFMYLSDVEEGGETAFPRAGGLPQPSKMDDCSVGIVSKPRAGKVVVFYMMTPDGGLDPYSLHGGCRVKNGTKWSANFWMWNKPRSGRTIFHHDTSKELSRHAAEASLSKPKHVRLADLKLEL